MPVEKYLLEVRRVPAVRTLASPHPGLTDHLLESACWTVDSLDPTQDWLTTYWSLHDGGWPSWAWAVDRQPGDRPPRGSCVGPDNSGEWAAAGVWLFFMLDPTSSAPLSCSCLHLFLYFHFGFLVLFICFLFLYCLLFAVFLIFITFRFIFSLSSSRPSYLHPLHVVCFSFSYISKSFSSIIPHFLLHRHQPSIFFFTFHSTVPWYPGVRVPPCPAVTTYLPQYSEVWWRWSPRQAMKRHIEFDSLKPRIPIVWVNKAVLHITGLLLRLATSRFL